MPTYTDNNRYKKITPGDETGTWGSTTNSLYDVIDDINAYTTYAMSDADDTITISDGVASTAHYGFIEVTGTFTADRTLTIGPNTIGRYWFIKNGTSGGFNLLVKQGTGGSVTIAAGSVAIIYFDGAGAGAAAANVFDAAMMGSITTTGNAIIGGTLGVTGATTLGTATITNADINGGTIDGTVIGGSSAAAGSFTTIAASGNYTAASSASVVFSARSASGLTDALRFPDFALHNPSSGILAINNYTSDVVTVDSTGALATTGAITSSQAGSADTVVATFETTAASTGALFDLNRVDATGVRATLIRYQSSGADQWVAGIPRNGGSGHSARYIIGRNYDVSVTPAAFTIFTDDSVQFAGAVSGITTLASTNAISVTKAGTHTGSAADLAVFYSSDATNVADVALRLSVYAQDWRIGIDNSNADALVIGQGGGWPATGGVLTLATSGAASFASSVTAASVFDTTGTGYRIDGTDIIYKNSTQLEIYPLDASRIAMFITNAGANYHRANNHYFSDSTGSNTVTLASGALSGITTLAATGAVSVGGNFQLTGVAGTARYIYTDENAAGTGAVNIQAGLGSAGFGGGIILYAHSHATHPGDVVAGISASSGGAFRVNGWGVDGGPDYLTVNGTAATFAGAVQMTNASNNSSMYADRALLWTANGLNTGTLRGGIYGDSSANVKIATGPSFLTGVTVDSAQRTILGGNAAVVGSRLEVLAVSNGDGITVLGRAADDLGYMSFYNNAGTVQWGRIANGVMGYGGVGAYSGVLIGGHSSARGNVFLGYDPSANTSGNFNGNGQVFIKNGVSILSPNALDTGFVGLIGSDANDNVRVGGSLSGGTLYGDGIVINSTNGYVGIGVDGGAPGYLLTVTGAGHAMQIGEASTSATYMGFTSNGGTHYIGIEGSAGGIQTGASAYDLSISAAASGTGVSIGTQGTAYWRLSGGTITHSTGDLYMQNGFASIVDSADTTLSVLSTQNTSTGLSAINRLRIGNSGSVNAFTIDVYGSSHSTSPNKVNIFNQFGADLVLGSNGNPAITINSSLDTTAAGNLTVAANMGIGDSVSTGTITGLEIETTVSGGLAGIGITNVSTDANSSAFLGFTITGSRVANIVLNRATTLLEITDSYNSVGNVRWSLNPLTGDMVVGGSTTMSDDEYIYWGGAVTGIRGNGTSNSLSFVTNGSTWFNISSSGVGTYSATLDVVGDLRLTATQKLYFDTGSDTYIHEVGSDNLEVVVGSKALIRFTETASTGDVSLQSGVDLLIEPTTRFYLDGGGDTYITESSANTLSMFIGTGVEFRLNNLGWYPATTNAYDLGIASLRWRNLYLSNDATIGGDLTLAATNRLYLDGGSDTYLTESAADVMSAYVGGTEIVQLYENGTTGALEIRGADNGTSTGANLILQRNTNATTPAAGFITFYNRAGTAYYVWVDSVGDLRIGTSLPTNAQDSSGDPVGTQT